MRDFNSVEKHPGPGGRSLQFSIKQWTFFFHGFHEEALRGDDRLVTHCTKLLNHTRCGRALPKHSREACIEASDSEAAQGVRWDILNKGLHGRCWSKSLCWAPQNEQVDPLVIDGMRWISSDDL